jgi:uncharacterized protein with ParB-like and HNH nuclease domain
MEAGRRTISDIFNGSRALQIPFFQRAYVWKEPQWQRFLEDMIMISETNRPHFLGSVILKQQQTETGRGSGDIRTVVDGQQRLTTLYIFFKVLCLQSGRNESFNRKFRLLDNSIALDHNRHDKPKFEKIVNLDAHEEIESESNITKAYKYFQENLDYASIDFNSVLSNVMFVGIDLGITEDEQQIFDTINSLGVTLTTAELLKNYFFSRENVELFQEHWEQLFETDDETKEFWDRELVLGRLRRYNIDVFFHAFLQIKIQDENYKVTAIDKKRFSRVDVLFESYKSFISIYYGEENKNNLLREIKEYATLYRSNIDSTIVGTELIPSYGVERINAIIFGLDNSTLIPYVLYLLKATPDDGERNLIYQYLEAYIMRRMVNKDSNKNYNRLFSAALISSKVNSKLSLKENIEKKADKVDGMPEDSQVEDSFHNNKLINKQAAGILYMIESRIRNRAIHSTALLGLNRYSLEHLMPKKWENNWNNVESEDLIISRNNKLLTLGNLAIITSSLNSSIRDASWESKKDGRGKYAGLNAYSGGIETLAKYLEYPEWNESTIEERSHYLYEKAIEVWPK